MSEFTDENAGQVHQFALEMSNLGLSRIAELVIAMLESGRWQSFRDGLGNYKFLPGEFDYFLTQQGVSRDLLMNGIRDVTVKARLEEAMDERRTGEAGYRRPVAEAREQLPDRPGQPIEPFGYSRAEARTLGIKGSAREPLGRAPRQFRLTDGKTTRRPNEQRSRVEQLTASIRRLSDDDLSLVSMAVSSEIASREAQLRIETP